MRSLLASLLCVLALATFADAQPFSSGSTGADGALDLGAMTCSTCVVQLSESGVMHYTTVNVPSGKTLVFRPNWRNTPVVLLATGQVTIAGRVLLQTGWDWIHSPNTPGYGSATENWPGPGGFFGGTYPNGLGMGPGGGSSPGAHGAWVGPLALVPLIGGSGGAASNSTNSPGGGGGGAITIASSVSITVSSTGVILASGARLNVSAKGSGGAIRLVANTVTMGGTMEALGASAEYHGLIRVEGPAGAVTFTGTTSPPAILANTINPIVVPATVPSLRIVSIGGYPVPEAAGRRQDTADLVLPRSMPEPLNVEVQGTQIPVGTMVTLVVNPVSGTTVTPAALAGTLESSSARLTLTGASRTAVTYVFVSATFDVPASASAASGSGDVARIRVDAQPGKPATFAFLRSDGTEIEPSSVPTDLRVKYGQRR